MDTQVNRQTNLAITGLLVATLAIAGCGESNADSNPPSSGSVELTLATNVRDELIGLEYEEFEARVESLGFTSRVVRRDGQPLEVTADFEVGRLDVAVDDNIVVEILFPE